MARQNLSLWTVAVQESTGLSAIHQQALLHEGCRRLAGLHTHSSRNLRPGRQFADHLGVLSTQSLSNSSIPRWRLQRACTGGAAALTSLHRDMVHLPQVPVSVGREPATCSSTCRQWRCQAHLQDCLGPKPVHTQHKGERSHHSLAGDEADEFRHALLHSLLGVLCNFAV